MPRRSRYSGDKTAHELFGVLDPVGQTVRVGNMPFVIIGVLASKGAGVGGQNQDDRVVIPYTTAMKRITGDKYLRSVNLEIGQSERIPIAQDQITQLLRQRHRLLPDNPDDFNIFNQQEIANTVNTRDLDPDAAAGRDRRAVPGRGRYRHHEHHAGQCHRADP